MDRKMLDYLPTIMQDVSEIVQISNAEQKSKERLWDDIYRMFNENYASTQTTIGLSRWEQTLNLVPKETDSLEARRVKVLGKLLADIPYTVRTFQAMLDTLCGENGYLMDMDFDNNIINISLFLSMKQVINELIEVSEAIIPAHILLTVSIRYNTHRVLKNSGLSNKQLQQYTHAQIQEELSISGG